MIQTALRNPLYMAGGLKNTRGGRLAANPGITSQLLRWRTHSCVRRRVSTRRFRALGRRAGNAVSRPAGSGLDLNRRRASVPGGWTHGGECFKPR